MHSFLPDDNHITNLGSCSPPFYDRNVCISHIEFQMDATLRNCDCLRGSGPRVEGLLVPYKLSGAPVSLLLLVPRAAVGDENCAVP
jgi:hypothetical protein